jgi:hypothetical protein
VTGPVKRAGDRDLVVARLIASLPALQTATALEMLRLAKADHWRSLRELADHLSARPDALSAPATDAPVALLRLCQVLHAAGHADVTDPACAGCGRSGLRLIHPSPNGRLCGTCKSRHHHGVCPRCGRHARLVARRSEGVICGSCYDRDPARRETCDVCGEQCIPESRTSDGAARCGRCHPKPAHRCIACGMSAPAATLTAEGATCYRCYQRPRRRCGRCGRVRAVKLAATVDGPDLCDSCYRGRDAVCVTCHRTRPCYYVRTGQPTCASCRPEPKRRCDRCGRTRPIAANWPIGAVCVGCYDHVRANPSPCSACATVSPLIAGDTDKPTCGPCAGIDVDYTCVACGKATLIFRDRTCHRCVLVGRLADLLAGPAGEIHPQLQPLATALAAVDKPHTVYIWLTYSPAARLLLSLAATGEPLGHAVLDTLTPSKAVHYVRDVLVTTGILPERDEFLERLTPFVDNLVADQPAVARVVKPYAQWFLVHRARRRRRAASLTSKGTAERLRAQIRAAVALLGWLHDQHLDLADLDQPTLDHWLAEHQTQHDHVANFITWTSRHRLTRQLHVTRRQRSAPATFLTDDEHTAQLRRCLHEPAMPAEHRLAGALALLFGLPLTRVTAIRTEHITQTPDATFLTMGEHRLRLPPTVANLVAAHLSAPRSWQILERHKSPSPWLFPGLSPTRPVSSSKALAGLHRHGITVLAGRNSARTALATELPAAVLADLTGVNISTAVAWSRQAKRDWTDLIAARSPT